MPIGIAHNYIEVLTFVSGVVPVLNRISRSRRRIRIAIIDLGRRLVPTLRPSRKTLLRYCYDIRLAATGALITGRGLLTRIHDTHYFCPVNHRSAATGKVGSINGNVIITIVTDPSNLWSLRFSGHRKHNAAHNYQCRNFV